MLEDILKSDISTIRPSVITITITSISKPQSIVEELQFIANKVSRIIDKDPVSTKVTLRYKLIAIIFRELEDSPELNQSKTFVKCQRDKEIIWYEISQKGDEHIPHGSLVTSHEVSSIIPDTQFQLNCFCSNLRPMFQESTFSSSSSSSSSSTSSTRDNHRSRSKRAAVLYYCKSYKNI